MSPRSHGDPPLAGLFRAIRSALGLASDDDSGGRCSCGYSQPHDIFDPTPRSVSLGSEWVVVDTEITDAAYVEHEERHYLYRCIDCGEVFHTTKAIKSRTNASWREDAPDPDAGSDR